MIIDKDPKLDFADVLLRPKRSQLLSRSEVDLRRRIVMPHSGSEFYGIPIIAANMDHTGTFEMADVLNEYSLCTALHKHYPAKELIKNFNNLSDWRFYSLGINEADLNKFKEVYATTDGSIHAVCIDVANGYSKKFLEFVKRFRDEFPDLTIMAGNVVTGDMTQDLIYHGGVDIVKVGIGPGSVCTTRKMTGVGYPQLSAIIECADAAHGVGGHICADGGCQVPGDVAKAFAAGADFVMLGGMLAGHDECNGLIVDQCNCTMTPEDIEMYGNEELYMRFYGMSSRTAMDTYHGGVADYRASEGKEVLVPYKGPVKHTVKEILGGVRSACTYVGAEKLKNLPKCATFIMVNRQLNTVFGNE